MTKMIKMSLVAAVAVAGITSTASAKSLEDSIKNVDFSGSVEYRMENRTTKVGAAQAGHTSGENAKIVLKTKSPVNDSVTFNAKMVLNTQASSQSDSTATTSAAPLNVMGANFTAKIAGATVVAGLQDLATPWTDAGDGARANGLLALVPVGPVTVAAAHFRNSNMGVDSHAALDANDLTALAVIGKAGPVAYQAWYLDIASTSTTDLVTALQEGGDALALLATAKVGPASVDASYASLEGAKSSLKKQTLIKAIASAKAGPATVVAGFAKGGKDGDLVTFDPDAKVGFESWMIRAGQGNQCDLTAVTVAGVAPVGPVALKVQYTAAEFDAANTATTGSTEVSEILVQASYKMSKNLSTYLRYAMVDQDAKATSTAAVVNTEISRARLSIKYTF